MGVRAEKKGVGNAQMGQGHKGGGVSQVPWLGAMAPLSHMYSRVRPTFPTDLQLFGCLIKLRTCGGSVVEDIRRPALSTLGVL